MSKVRPKILLADDYPRVLEKLSQLLRLDFEVVGAVDNGVAAVDAVARLRPDVVIMDVSMPVMDGFQAAREIRKMELGCKILILSALNDPTFVTWALESGCRGYVLKSRMGSDLILALREVLAGRIFPLEREKQPEPQSAQLAPPTSPSFTNT